MIVPGGLLLAIAVVLAAVSAPTPAQDAYQSPAIDCAGLFPPARCREIVRIALREVAADGRIASARAYEPVSCWQGVCETRSGADIAVVAFFDGAGQLRALVMVGTTGVGAGEHAWRLPDAYAERLGLPPPPPAPSPLPGLLIAALALVLGAALLLLTRLRRRPPARAEPDDTWAAPQ